MCILANLKVKANELIKNWLNPTNLVPSYDFIRPCYGKYAE